MVRHSAIPTQNGDDFKSQFGAIPALDQNRQTLTLDDHLKIWAIKSPDATAFSSVAFYSTHEDQPLKYTYSEANRIADRLADQFLNHGLKPGDVLAIQLPNVTELPILILAALRANLIPCPIPILWRAKELDQAFRLVPPRAIITAGKFDDHQHSQMMCDIAFDHLSVRFVYGIGPDQADGLTALDGFFANKTSEAPSPNSEQIARPDQPAIITWCTRPNSGVRPIYRTHQELISMGLLHVLEIGLTSSDKLLSPFPVTGLVGLSGMFVPALLTGATLIQHHPFDYSLFIKQLAAEQVTYTAAPAQVLKTFTNDYLFESYGKFLDKFGCVWQTPNLQNESDKTPDVSVFDIHNLNETSIYISKRRPETLPGHIQLGEKSFKNPISQENISLLETRFRGRMKTVEGAKSKYHGTLYVRGSVVSRSAALPDRTRRGQDTQEGWVNTGIQCSILDDSQNMDQVICEPDGNVIYHGGIMLYADQIDELYRSFDGFEDAVVLRENDPIMGEQLIVAARIKNSGTTLEDVIAHLKESGAAPYTFPTKMIPLAEIPRNANGEVLRDQIVFM